MSLDERTQGVLRFVDKAHAQLDRITYYQILNVKPDCSARDARTAYYKLAQRLHPDLYGDSIDAGARARLTAVYSRVVEAYQVLTSGEKRTLYNKLLAGGEHRLTLDATKAQRKAEPEDEIENAGAKKFYRLGIAALQSGDRKSAAMNLKMALSMEPEAKVIAQALEKAKEGAGG